MFKSTHPVELKHGDTIANELDKNSYEPHSRVVFLAIRFATRRARQGTKPPFSPRFDSVRYSPLLCSLCVGFCSVSANQMASPHDLPTP